MTGIVLALLLAADGGVANFAWAPIEVTATPQPLTPEGATKQGPLTFRGAVELTSSTQTFGGLSGMRWRDGKLYAVSDKRGTLFRFSPVLDAKGVLVGVNGAEATTLEIGDGEALEFVDDTVWISNEDDTTLSRFPPGSRTAMPEDGWNLAHNKGFEALAVNKDCALIFAEAGNTGFVGKPEALATASPNLTALPWPADFSPTDVVWVTPGKLAYAVLRKFDGKVYGGIARITLKSCAPAGFKVEVLTQWGAPTLVDNFEAIAIIPGTKEIFVLSDDNFRTKGPQRTLLLKFSVP